jgi:ABC transporter transmembrane region
VGSVSLGGFVGIHPIQFHDPFPDLIGKYWTLFDNRLYLQAVLRQNVAFFDRLGAGEVTNRVSNDAELIREGISDKVRIPHPSPGIPFAKMTQFSCLSSSSLPLLLQMKTLDENSHFLRKTGN